MNAFETTSRKKYPAMTMTDPIADMLTRLRNANQAYHDSVSMPYSKLKAGVATILQQEGYIGSWKVDEGPDAGKRRRQDARRRPQVRPEPRALDRRHPPDQQARSARVRQGHRPAQGPRRPRHRHHLDVDRSADRSSGQAEGRRWGSPRLRLVARTAKEELRNVTYWQAPHPGAVRCRRSDRRPDRHGQGPQGHRCRTPCASRSRSTRPTMARSR